MEPIQLLAKAVPVTVTVVPTLSVDCQVEEVRVVLVVFPFGEVTLTVVVVGIVGPPAPQVMAPPITWIDKFEL